MLKRFANRITHRVGFALTISGATLVVLALAWLSVLRGSNDAAAANGALFVVTAPAQVKLGEQIPLTLTVQNGQDVAGYEVHIQYNTQAAELSDLAQGGDIKALGRAIVPLAVMERPEGVAVGMASCPYGNCITGKGTAAAQGASGTVKLGVVTLAAHKAGALEIRIDAVKVVDSQGNALPVAVQPATLTVQVGSASLKYAAPAGGWKLANAVSGTPGPFAVTGRKAVTHADIMETALEWTRQREKGQPCVNVANLDVNHDGCLDVADVQMVAAHATPLGSLNTPAAPKAPAKIFTVTTTTDDADTNPGDGICVTVQLNCSFRAALTEANLYAGPSTINFTIPGTGVHTIQLFGNLPIISNVNGTITIDGYTQPGSTANTDPVVDNAHLTVEIRGQDADHEDALAITSAGHTVRGIAFYNLRNSFYLYGTGAHDNVIVGNFIGTDSTGTFTYTGLWTEGYGVKLEQAASHNRIGGTTAAERNVISGNARSGITMYHDGTVGNIVYNNIIGLSPLGDRRLSNQLHGVDMNFGTSDSIVGGLAFGQRNVLSGNNYTGAEVSHSATTTNNHIIGNYIGTDLNGSATKNYTYNGLSGVSIKDHVNHNLVTDNVIVNNKSHGIKLDDFTTCCAPFNVFQNNRIGIGVDGSSGPNTPYGFWVNAPQATIGPGNIITNNPKGIVITGTTSVQDTITRNSIYGNTPGIGIDLGDDGVTVNSSNTNGPNHLLNYPVIGSATNFAVTGTACANCTVEVFVAVKDPTGYGQGKTYVGSAVAASSGSFVVPVAGVAVGNWLTATATDPNGNTSEFSLDVQAAAGVPPARTYFLPVILDSSLP